MQKGIFIFITGLLAGIALTVILITVILPKQMFIVNESKYGFEETLKAIEKSAEENKWGIPHQYDLQATLKGKGFDVNPVNVFSLCKPDHAYKILGSNEERLVSALMPCRVAVYEKEGKTYVSMLNSGLFSRFMGKRVKDVMGDASEENKQILEPVVK
ncbi:DUF302 domain-containing protein [Draconibacterium sp.]|nr:DUF302 domain-containing protein [Draconibacterium sp.]